MKVFSFLINRLREPSTIRGIIVGFGLLGVKISPELTESIIQSTLSFLATYEMFRKEEPKI